MVYEHIRIWWGQKGVTGFGEYKVGAFKRQVFLDIRGEGQELKSFTMSENRNKNKNKQVILRILIMKENKKTRTRIQSSWEEIEYVSRSKKTQPTNGGNIKKQMKRIVQVEGWTFERKRCISPLGIKCITLKEPACNASLGSLY